MIGILIVSHGDLAKEMLNTACMILGEQQNVKTLSLMYDDDIKEFTEKILDATQELDQGDGVIVISDLFGGSPNNSVAAISRLRSFKAITGVNLPMLIECLSSREFLNIDELVHSAKCTGIGGIKLLSDIL